MLDKGNANFMKSAFLNDFRKAFRDYPCLWKVNSDEHRDQNECDKAFNTLFILIQQTIHNAGLSSSA